MAPLGEESSLPDLLGISVLQNELNFSLGEYDEVYEGYGRVDTMYPYRQCDSYHRTLTQGTSNAAILENDFLKAVFLTEYGGRLWELWDKKTGKNLLYTNDVLRFSNLASRNAWFSGGVEWNVGVIGHSPFTAEALYTAETATEEGYPVLRMYQYEAIRKVTWQIDFWLENDAFLNCAMYIYNESPDVIPMYWWSNIAVPEYKGGRVIVPADSAFTSKNGLVYKVPIPMVDNIDITDYQNIPYSVDYFFDIPKKSPKYIANVNPDGFGLLQISSDRLQSRKLFCWGHQDASLHWQRYLTEKQSDYIEIQAGLGKTQYGCVPMAPHTTWMWVERYGAVQIPPEDIKASHAERTSRLTKTLYDKHLPQSIELLETKARTFSKKEAVLLQAGKLYDAENRPRKNSAHLHFETDSESHRNWQQFFRTGILHQPDTARRPDEFPIDRTNLPFMEDACRKPENAANWYAFYHLGLGYFQNKNYTSAVAAFEKSDCLAQNAWAKHGLSCAYLKLGNTQDSVRSILDGMNLRTTDASYLKEGFRILAQNNAFELLLDFYETLGQAEKQIGKLRYYQALALFKTGKPEESLALLRENGGIEMDDTREGENLFQQLWEDLTRTLYGTPLPAPTVYTFRTSE